ncbi:MAG: TfoX/Sxy family protein [Verrucomicrobia bacterium]|nr:TfoX/Sxy family protein [Verrucomicrobiota bacterium]
MADESFNEFVREQLAGLGVEFRRMFGGHGLYQGEVFFGILHRGRLYFKTDDLTRSGYEAAGMGKFQPNAKQCLSAYFEVPAAVLENADMLCAWASRAARCTK